MTRPRIMKTTFPLTGFTVARHPQKRQCPGSGGVTKPVFLQWGHVSFTEG
jgi:hypothetical protein